MFEKMFEKISISLIDIVIMFSAVWRLSSLLVDEDGLFDMFERLRTWFGIRYVNDGTSAIQKVVPDDTPAMKKIMAKWLVCRWCCSLWMGGLLTVLCTVFPSQVVLTVLLPFSLSSLAIVVDAVVSRRYKRRVYFG